jgi:putative oxidoreductase
MIRTIISTDDSIAIVILRLVLGVVFFAEGAQKMLGWFGGSGFAGTMGFFIGTMHIPAPLAFLAICAEFLGGMGLIIGLLTRIAAFGIATNMVVAIATVHRHFGFFMNWNGTQKGEGFEFHLLVLAIAAFLMIRGAGAFSVDHALSTKAPSFGGHGAVWNRRETMKKNIEKLALPAWPLPWRGCWWAVAPGRPSKAFWL